jgi:hypothetical protein
MQLVETHISENSHSRRDLFHGFLKKCEVFRISAGYNEKERKKKKTETQREGRTKKTKQNNKGAQQ